MKKLIVFSVAAALLVFSAPIDASAQTPTPSTTIQDLLKKITELQKQIEELRAKQQQTVAELVKELQIGDRGDAVKELQALLAAEGIFKVRITGYFGALTRQAVIEFQKRTGLPQVGRVGPQTMAKIRERWEDRNETVAIEKVDDAKDSHRACLPPGHLISPGQKAKGLPNLPPCKDPLPPGIVKLLGRGGPGGKATTTPSPTPSATPSPSASPSPTATPTPSPTVTPTPTPSPTVTPTPSPTATPTPTPTPSATPTPTPTPTPSPTPTP